MYALASFKAAGQVGKEVFLVGELLTLPVLGGWFRAGERRVWARCGQVLFGYGLCSLVHGCILYSAGANGTRTLNVVLH